MELSLAIQTPEVDRVVPVALLSGTLEGKLDKAVALGADGLELMTSDPARLDAPSIRAQLARRGLAAAAIGSGAAAMAGGLALLAHEAEARVRAASRLGDLIRFAAAVGAPLVTIGSFRGRLATFDGDGRAYLAAVLAEAADRAAALGVRLALEPVNRYESDVVNNADEGAAFVCAVGHPALGLLLDTYHVNIEESSWTEPFRRLSAAGILWHVHLGDNNRLPPGRGLIDFAAIVATLHEVEYHGFLSAELLARPDPDTAARQTICYMRGLLART
ncbi:MAG: sugar phosphate isomerase/epimerase family protein [Anaerolineae bacterium]